MGGASQSWVALIRAIGPATHKKMSMQMLREGCEAAGLEDVRTYIASGNLLFRSSASATSIKQSLARILNRHGLDNDIFLRRPDALAATLSINPFPDAGAARPNHVLVVFLENQPTEDEVAAVLEHTGPENIAAAGREIFIDYVEGVGRSKLTPALIERRLKQPGTARNINTIQKLITLTTPT